VSRNAWIAIGVVVFLLVVGGGGAVVVKWTEERRRVRVELRKASRRFGLVPEYLEAIAGVENRWRISGTNLAGPDGARGGAWGATQITERTARGHGYTGAMAALNADPALAAEWTGRILAAAHGRRRLTTLADYVAAWNAGRDDADKNNDGRLDELPESHPTRRDYLPRAESALAAVRASPVPESVA